MKRKIVIIEGPYSKQAKENAHRYLIEIAKRYIKEGKYTKSIS